MRVCRRCGGFAQAELGPCEACGSDLHTNLARVDRVAPCAAARVQRICERCSRRIPLDGLPGDGRLACPSCSAEQHLSRSDWAELLDRLHAVADLLDDDPEGMAPSTWAIDEVNPFSATKRTTSGVWYVQDTIGRDEGLAAPGGPLSERWRVWVTSAAPMSSSGTAFEIEDEADALKLRADGAVVRYGVEAGWRALAPSLRGVLSDAHELGRTDPDAVFEPGAGSRPARLSCPSCTGPLRVPKRSRVRCEQCRRVVHVPAKARRAVSRETDADLLYFVFRGRSPMRTALERSAPGQRPLVDPPPRAESGLEGAARVTLLVALPLAFLALAGSAPLLLAWLGG